MVSSPPPVRFKLLLFGVFIVLVAVVTFMVLYMLKPFESKKHIRTAPAKEAPVATPKPATPVAKPEPKPEPAKALPKKTTAPKPDDPDPAPAPSTGAKATVGQPQFKEDSGKWQITFKASPDVKCKHFTLKDPPRLAVDFLNASYTGSERLLDSPVPFISKIRVGEKPEYTRYVIDFDAEKVPKYEVVNEKEGVLVTFGNES